MVGIYKITNLVNNKKYIGQSRNIEQRWRAHRSKPFCSNTSNYNTPLYRAIRKYGLKNFSFEVIEACTIEELDEKEKFYISYFDTTNSEKGYNLTPGGYEPSINCKINDDNISLIYDLLMNSTLTETEIANQFSVSQRYISGINLGEYKILPGFSYPLKNYRKKKKKYCQCGNEILSKAEVCVECARIALRKCERPSREQLKNEIRTCSFTELSKKYGVSDNAIKKWCKIYSLPFRKMDIKQISDKDWSMI